MAAHNLSVETFFGANGTALSLKLKFNGDRKANTANSQRRPSLKWGAFSPRSAKIRYACQKLAMSDIVGIEKVVESLDLVQK